MTPNLPSRRQLLKSAACGFGYLAFAGLSRAAQVATNPLAPREPRFPARAKRVIFLYMRGGPAHMDTFDYKPLLQRDDGKPLPFALPKLQQMAGRGLGKLMGSPFKFRQHGQSGVWMSELFPELARHADKLCVLNGMHTEGVDHGQAMTMLHTGNGTLVRPSMGSWVVYGLGTENQSFPGFISICPFGNEARGYANVFLPAAYQGTVIGSSDAPVAKATIRHLCNDCVPAAQQRKQLDLLAEMNREHLAQRPGDGQLEGAIQSFELAARMQNEAPKLMDLSTESADTLRRYGIGAKVTDDFGRQCLMARRMAEAGVRYVQLNYFLPSGLAGIPNWDQHDNRKRDLPVHATAVDRPIAALLADLEARGLLEDTLVWWGGEFGRTPVTQGGGGRDHNPYGFTMWLAGGGVKGGTTYGRTDDYGYYAAEDKVHVHDLQATILHLMGLDHEELTYRYAGRDFRLTDVEGRVVHEIIG